MPSYEWICKCGATTPVLRKMADIDLGPDNGCDSCASKDLERTIQVPKEGAKTVIWKCGGNHDSTYTKYRSRN